MLKRTLSANLYEDAANLSSEETRLLVESILKLPKDEFEQIVDNRRNGQMGNYDFGKNSVAASYNLMKTFVGHQPK